MADVDGGHYEAVVADGCSFLRVESAIDDDMLADDVVVAYAAERRLVFPAEVLGIGSDDGILVDFVVLA